jgi:hypothetical protein
MGPGDALFEKFGHNALGVRDRSRGTDVAYNWGVFRLDDPTFVPRFIFGETRYAVEAYDAQRMLAAYMAFNRSIDIQELNLTPAQRAAIRDFVEWNVREENKFYRYDYFGDNCSTRVRDALDRALGGAIKARFDTMRTTLTRRGEMRRLADGSPVLTGMNLWLGAPADAPMSAYESMFIPMRMRDALREVRVPGDSGLVPLVVAERRLFDAARPAEPSQPVDRRGLHVVVGLVIAALLLASVRGGSRALPFIWVLLVGFVGAFLALLWFFTRHTWSAANLQLLYVNPLWLGLLAAARSRQPLIPRQRAVALLCAALAGVGVVSGAVNVGQVASETALLMAAPHAVLLVALLRRRGDA